MTDAATASSATASTGAVRLSEWGLIRASGADAASFLHGQLTQDVQGLPADGARLAGFCSAKGRLLASFVIWRDGTDALLLALSADLLPATLKRLKMFVLRAKCQLDDVTADRPLWGLAGETAAAVLPGSVQRGANGGTLVRLDDAAGGGEAGAAVPRALWVGDAPEAAPGPAGAASPLEPLSAQAWAALEVASGTARVVAATSDHFVPQMVNFELVGGVNFQKGCYPGQEVVARSQYRGTLKRRMHRFALVAQAEAPTPGTEIFHSADPSQPAGEVVLAAPATATSAGEASAQLLAMVKLAALEGGDLHLGTADGPVLRPLSLPYPVRAPE